jgi:glucose-6-phosphate-specific signal transduction histidine kinase
MGWVSLGSPRVQIGFTMFLPVVSACWLFRFRGLLISLVLNVVAFQLAYFFLLQDIVPDQAFVVKGGLLGISLGLGLGVCWLRTAVGHMHTARSLAQASEQKQRQTEHLERTLAGACRPTNSGFCCDLITSTSFAPPLRATCTSG